MPKTPSFAELIAATTTSAVHLETRDAYTPDDPAFADWKAGRPVMAPTGEAWYNLVREHAVRGVRFRRALRQSRAEGAVRLGYESAREST